MAADAVLARAAAGRRRVADLVETLGPAELDTPSLCAGWRVRDVVGHLVMSVELGTGRFLLAVVRDRGRVARTSERLGVRYGERPATELVAALRRGADRELAPPGIGPMGPMADTCVHLRDIAVPLGRAVTAPLDDWRLVLDFLVTARARAGGFLPRGRLDGLRLVATDLEWSHGTGPTVSGPAEALALAATGRRVALTDLGGDGVTALGARLPPR